MARGRRQQGATTTLNERLPFDELVYDLNDRLSTLELDAHLELVPSSEQGVVYLEVLVVKPAKRDSGIGSRITEEICAEADDRGWVLRLAPIASDLEGRDRLARYYARFGFAFDGSAAGMMERKPGSGPTDPHLELAGEPDFVEPGHFDQYVGG